jgi:hypothetical protein
MRLAVEGILAGACLGLGSRRYPSERFGDGGNNVVVFDIQDHTPPTMEIQIGFLTDAEEYMKESLSRGRVIAVHCRGGKGRTGSLVCAWLFYSGFCRTAAVTLEYVLTTHLPRSSRWPTCVYDEVCTMKMRGLTPMFCGVDTGTLLGLVPSFGRESRRRRCKALIRRVRSAISTNWSHGSPSSARESPA